MNKTHDIVSLSSADWHNALMFVGEQWKSDRKALIEINSVFHDTSRLVYWRVLPTDRPADEISLPELSALAQELRAAGVSEDALLAEMARALGLQQLRAASRMRLDKASQSQEKPPTGL